MIVDTLLPVFAGEHIGWLRWRIPLFVFGALAVTALALQLRLTWKEEKENNRLLEEDRNQRQESDKRFEQLAKLLDGKKPSAPVTNSPNVLPLRERVLALGHDLFAFLKEKGPRPSDPLNHLRDSNEIWYAAQNKWGPYVTAIHYGYLHRFRQRTVDLFNELAEHHVPFNVERWEIDPPQAVREVYVRKIAEECFLIAARMEISEQSKNS